MSNLNNLLNMAIKVGEHEEAVSRVKARPRNSIKVIKHDGEIMFHPLNDMSTRVYKNTLDKNAEAIELFKMDPTTKTLVING